MPSSVQSRAATPKFRFQIPSAVPRSAFSRCGRVLRGVCIAGNARPGLRLWVTRNMTTIGASTLRDDSYLPLSRMSGCRRSFLSAVFVHRFPPVAVLSAASCFASKNFLAVLSSFSASWPCINSYNGWIATKD